MKDIARQIRLIVETAEPQLARMNPDEVGFKPAPHQWSKKEILGHLIDSAANNHHRFVRTVNEAAVRFPAYDQDGWVRIQRYNETPWSPLVVFWSAYNIHLSRIVEFIPEDAEAFPCNIGTEEPVPLGFVVKDYLRHLRHHLKDILGKHAVEEDTNRQR